MIALVSALLMLTAAGPVDMRLAPDHALPIVYLDDPVVLGLDAPAPAQFTGRTRVGCPNGEVVEAALGDIALDGLSPLWRTLAGLPQLRGPYLADVALVVDGAPRTLQQGFCILERPGSARLALGATIPAPDQALLRALANVPVRQFRIVNPAPETWEALRNAAAPDVDFVVALDLTALESPDAYIRDLAAALGSVVEMWEIQGGDDADDVGLAIAALRASGATAPRSIAARSSRDVETLLSEGAGRLTSAWTVRSDAEASELPGFRAALDRAGYEGQPLHAVAVTSALEDEPGAPQIAQQLLLNYAAGADCVYIDSSVLVEGREVRPALAFLSGLVHRLDRTVFVGEIDLPQGARNVVFSGADGWIVAMWSNENALEVTLDVDAAEDLLLTDVFNNPLPVPDIADGKLTLTLTNHPLMLGGASGGIYGEAARRMAQREARALKDIEGIAAHLGAELQPVVNAVTAPDFDKLDRGDFLGLLLALHNIELRWHSGELPRSVAAPAIAGLTRLLRELSVLEEEAGDPFVEPLSDTLTRARDFLSHYLTNSTSAAREQERADIILKEVARLIADAERLAGDGRRIEATAVAALAEWRARTLEFAAEAAPLSEPDPFVELAEQPSSK